MVDAKIGRPTLLAGDAADPGIHSLSDCCDDALDTDLNSKNFKLKYLANGFTPSPFGTLLIKFTVYISSICTHPNLLEMKLQVLFENAAVERALYHQYIQPVFKISPDHTSERIDFPELFDDEDGKFNFISRMWTHVNYNNSIVNPTNREPQWSSIDVIYNMVKQKINNSCIGFTTSNMNLRAIEELILIPIHDNVKADQFHDDDEFEKQNIDFAEVIITADKHEIYTNGKKYALNQDCLKYFRKLLADAKVALISTLEQFKKNYTNRSHIK